MITEEKKIEKTCSFYASDYHLEMIMIPYINKKIEEKTNVTILTERNLNKTVKDVISKINLPEERKKEILKLNWEKSNPENLKKENNKEQTIFVVGSMNYIKNANEEIEKVAEAEITAQETQLNIAKTKIINCYSLEEAQANATEITLKHTKVLNTTEEKEIEKNYC